MKNITAPIIGATSKDKTQYQLDAVVFSQSLRPEAIAQVLRVYLSNQHQKTKKTKTRSEVAGSTHKIYKQKGTGYARHGSRKAPIYVGGGIALGPNGVKPANLSINHRLKVKAMASLLSDKLKDGRLFIIDTQLDDEPSTKKLAQLFHSEKLDDKPFALVVSPDDDKMVLSSRNLEYNNLISVGEVNALHLASNDKVILTPSAIETLQKRLLPYLSSK